VFQYLQQAAQQGKQFDLIVLDPPSFSNSKKMQDTLDIQRDQATLINGAMALLAPSGTLYFSNNLRSFELNPALAERYAIICFDEFHISDIADAMILERLLHAFFQHRLVFVMTSNYVPDALYPDGLHRDAILPAIALLNRNLDVLSVDVGTDYRQLTIKGVPAYLSPLNDANPAAPRGGPAPPQRRGRVRGLELDIAGAHLYLRQDRADALGGARQQAGRPGPARAVGQQHQRTSAHTGSTTRSARA